MNKYQKEKEKIRAFAIEWQRDISDLSLCCLDLAEWGYYFARVARRYGLTREFRENGII